MKARLRPYEDPEQELIGLHLWSTRQQPAAVRTKGQNHVWPHTQSLLQRKRPPNAVFPSA